MRDLLRHRHPRLGDLLAEVPQQRHALQGGRRGARRRHDRQGARAGHRRRRRPLARDAAREPRRRSTARTRSPRSRTAVIRRGYYPFRTDPEELSELANDEPRWHALFEEHMLKTVERWMAMADERLGGTRHPRASCARATTTSSRSTRSSRKRQDGRARRGPGRRDRRLPDGVVRLGEPHAVGHVPRGGRAAAAERIERMIDEVTTAPPSARSSACTARRTAPGSTTRRELTADMCLKDAGRATVPVGSTAVREAIEALPAGARRCTGTSTRRAARTGSAARSASTPAALRAGPAARARSSTSTARRRSSASFSTQRMRRRGTGIGSMAGDGAVRAAALFVRKATGLVRGWSVRDAFIYAAFSINLVTLGLYIFSLRAVHPERQPDLGGAAGGRYLVFQGITYASLIAAMPRAGGDYVWISRVLGGGIGFVLAVCGWWFILWLWVPIYANILNVEVLGPLAAIVGWNSGVDFLGRARRHLRRVGRSPRCWPRSSSRSACARTPAPEVLLLRRPASASLIMLCSCSSTRRPTSSRLQRAVARPLRRRRTPTRRRSRPA